MEFTDFSMYCRVDMESAELESSNAIPNGTNTGPPNSEEFLQSLPCSKLADICKSLNLPHTARRKADHVARILQRQSGQNHPESTRKIPLVVHPRSPLPAPETTAITGLTDVPSAHVWDNTRRMEIDRKDGRAVNTRRAYAGTGDGGEKAKQTAKQFNQLENDFTNLS